ncbi:cell division protein DedD [Candidatus Berkelbacteria bacterium RBG_13_40_8]|uniref:Cell division protein DedD n=1 Tax=Candidatus Berkelbacteria bacterium RBG_13_40_8 TaxID=1797467 RepID=A0A1F5DMF7_9BACT|nr:MAG: cell division protein DedD [Candidatus Berkelbacteria bacterium RBG_13_40_8]
MPRRKKQNNHKRPSWDEYFLKLVDVVGQRSTCDRGRPGCVIVKDRRVLTTGYAGSPVGMPHCDDEGHEMQKQINDDGTISEHCVRTLHAEMNAITQAAKFGISIDGATLYLKFTPCYNCAKMIVNSGIKRVVSQVKYHAGEKSISLFKRAKVKLEIIEQRIEKYERQ